MAPHPAPDPAPAPRTEAELAERDLTVLLRYGLTRPGPQRTALFGDGAVGAAVTLDGLGVRPRAVAYLAKLVRAGGVRHAATLPEVLPGAQANALVLDWLSTAAAHDPAVDGDEAMARWLMAVADVMGLREAVRPEG